MGLSCFPSLEEEKQTENTLRASRIFTEHGDFILSIISRKYQDNSYLDIDDIFHDFYISLIENPIPMEIRNIKSYLHKSIQNDIKDAVIKSINYQKRRHEHFLRNKNYSHSEPSSNIELREIFGCVQRALKDLPGNEATAILERHYHGNDISESSRKMDIKKRSFSRYLSAGLKKVRTLLKEKNID